MSKKIQSIKIIEDTISIDNATYVLTSDMAIQITTQDNLYTFSRGWFFDEHIYFSKNKNFSTIYPENKVVSDWDDDEDAPKNVHISRKFINI